MKSSKKANLELSSWQCGHKEDSASLDTHSTHTETVAT